MQFRVSEKELGKIFDKAKNTNDFIQAKSILLNDSRSIILFRLHLGISRNKFSRLLGKSVNTIANLERGNKKIITEEKANYYANKLSSFSELPLDINKIKNNYQK